MGLVVKACDETAGGAPMAQHPNTTKSQAQKKKKQFREICHTRVKLFIVNHALFTIV